MQTYGSDRISSNYPYDLGLFALPKFKQARKGRINQALKGFVCRTLFPAMLPNWALFAIHKNSVSDPNQRYLSRPFSPHAIRVSCAQITRPARPDNCHKRKRRQTRRIDPMAAICPCWRRCNVSSYPERFGLHNPPALAQCGQRIRFRLFSRFKSALALSVPVAQACIPSFAFKSVLSGVTRSEGILSSFMRQAILEAF